MFVESLGLDLVRNSSTAVVAAIVAGLVLRGGRREGPLRLPGIPDGRLQKTGVVAPLDVVAPCGADARGRALGALEGRCERERGRSSSSPFAGLRFHGTCFQKNNRTDAPTMPEFPMENFDS